MTAFTLIYILLTYVGLSLYAMYDRIKLIELNFLHSIVHSFVHSFTDRAERLTSVDRHGNWSLLETPLSPRTTRTNKAANDQTQEEDEHTDRNSNQDWNAAIKQFIYFNLQNLYKLS